MYDKETEDRALNKLYRDIEEWQDRNKPKEPQGAGIVAVLLALAMFALAIGLLLTVSGCNTLAGVGADIEAAARGTQDYLAEPDRGYTGK